MTDRSIRKEQNEEIPLIMLCHFRLTKKMSSGNNLNNHSLVTFV